MTYLKFVKRFILTAMLFTCTANWANAEKLEDSIYVYLNDSVKQGYKLKYIAIDTVEGNVIAEYENLPGKMAFKANYYNGKRTGVYTSWYPDGKKMETIIYQKGKKNGEYTLYDFSGNIIIKGVYWNNVKDGFWNYRKYYFYGKYKDGKKKGTWIWKNTDGKWRFEYKDGKLIRTPKTTWNFPRFILLN